MKREEGLRISWWKQHTGDFRGLSCKLQGDIIPPVFRVCFRALPRTWQVANDCVELQFALSRAAAAAAVLRHSPESPENSRSFNLLQRASQCSPLLSYSAGRPSEVFYISYVQPCVGFIHSYEQSRAAPRITLFITLAPRCSIMLSLHLECRLKYTLLLWLWNKIP